MRVMAYAAVLLACIGVGCAARMSELDIPDREAIYDRPLEEMWPEVRQFFTENSLPFREDKGSMVLQTEWRQEFGGSKVAGFWHRYMVLGKRESPTQSKLWIIRITKSANKALSKPGKEIDWGVSRALGANGGDGEISVEDMEAYFDAPQGENSHFAESGQGSRDLVMEWRVFRSVAPKLEKEKAQPVQVARAPDAKAAPNAMAIECGLPIIGLGKQVKQGGVLLLGEMHGTQEVPRFVAQTACQVMVAGTPVTVGLELPLENQTRVDAFLESAGGEDDWLKLMEAPFWRSPYPDGRSSEAVANMLEQLRQLRSRGLDVEVFVFDHPMAQGQARETAMAATVKHQVESAKNRFYVVLSGNVHSRTRQGLPWDKKFRPMGLLLQEALDDVVALDMAYDSGSAWICAVDSKGVKDRLDCGIRNAKGKDNGDRFFVHRWAGVNESGYHGVFYVGPVNASVPAVQRGLGRPGADENSARSASEQDASSAASH
ncbi:ChaN family lipoprotein [Pyxidicoccus xibeiensis]|uniref:ChaN family lipoprotein n=1 Tax=Pyxidicoccus xibeiensis TaxID=2906759 RepID=UPI0020A7AED2|nr:ChaN family lipoprotein [Pyxidicoccus xibeiensis]MCP3135721.1 ChaN family lipoprotein [Pyxidicoccus xibeiensis]